MKRSELFFTLVLLPLDFLALFAAGIAGYYSRFHPLFTKWRPVIFDLQLEQYISIIIPVICGWLFIFALSGLYTTRPPRIASEVLRVILAISTSMALVFAILFFSREFFESRFIAIASWILAIVFVALIRVIIRLLQRSLIRYGIGEHALVIIGDNKTSKTLATAFSRYRGLGFRVTQIFTEFNADTKKEIKKLKKAHKVDEILLADPEADRKTAQDLLTFTDANHLGFRYTADFLAASTGRSVFHTYAGIPVIEVMKTPLDGWGAIYKRIFDIVGSSLLIILFSPILLITTIALFIEQPGRVLFSRLPNGKKTVRIGQGGEPFHYYKFRSMIKNAHALRYKKEFLDEQKDLRSDSPLFKFKDDPRVTKVGKFIRRYSIDELPEFFLVLVGRMSLVGPRPHLPEEVKNYTPIQRKVMTVKPGITGLAQISGRSDLDFDEEVQLDIHYIEHWSPWTDLIILLKTPFIVLFRKQTES